MNIGLFKVAISVAMLSCAVFAQSEGKNTAEGKKMKNVTMMSYNIRTGFGDEKQGWYRFPKDFLGYLPNVARVIRETKPTWVAIQEVDNGMHRTGFVDQMDVLGTLTEMKGYFMDKTDFGEGVGHYGLGLLLKEKPISLKKIVISPATNDHTRILFAAELQDAIICTTHFSLRTSNRRAAVEIIKKEFANSEKPVFIGGDLNCDDDSGEFQNLCEMFVPLNGTDVKTFPSHEPLYCIDYIFVDKAHADKVEVKSVETPDIDLTATDHRPLVIKAQILP